MDLMSRVALLEAVNRDNKEEETALRVATHLDQAVANGKLGPFMTMTEDTHSSQAHTSSHHTLSRISHNLSYTSHPHSLTQLTHPLMTAPFHLSFF